MIIDVEFKGVIPAPSKEEYEGLEQSIIKEGCRDALITWQGILIDGHNRYEICTKHGIEYATIEKQFKDRDAVIEWIITNQFGRRNLSLYNRSLLALQLKPIFEQRAKENLVTHTADGYQGLEKSTKAVNTREELAKIAGVSDNTIARVEKIERLATPETKAQIKSGDISINQAYMDIAKPHVSHNSGENEWYTPKEYIDIARMVMGAIDCDPASSDIANKTVGAEIYFTAENNGLEQKWVGNVWMNPPYAQPLIQQFADKLISEIDNGNVEQACVLVNNATETQWFQSMAQKASAIWFMKGRVKFLDVKGNANGAPLQGQCMLYFGNKIDAFIRNRAGLVCRCEHD